MAWEIHSAQVEYSGLFLGWQTFREKVYVVDKCCSILGWLHWEMGLRLDPRVNPPVCGIHSKQEGLDYVNYKWSKGDAEESVERFVQKLKGISIWSSWKSSGNTEVLSTREFSRRMQYRPGTVWEMFWSYRGKLRDISKDLYSTNVVEPIKSSAGVAPLPFRVSVWGNVARYLPL